ncbi:MAG: bifunctional DNA primase/polymerase [Gammaproteobacteria bacterium]
MYRTLPLAPNTKEPTALSNGFYDAVYGPVPAGNYGIRTGEYSDGFFAVVDVDDKNDKNGFLSLQTAGIELPPTYTAATANGGKHYYYRTNTLLGSRNNVLEGVDLKGNLGYVVGPGSSVDGRAYTVVDDRPLATLPERFEALLATRQPRTVVTWEPTGKALDMVDAELKLIDPNIGYADWRDTLWCVMSIWGNTQNVLDACNDWSRQSPKYRPGDVERIWQSFDPEAFTADPHKRLGKLRHECPVLDAYLPSVPDTDLMLADKLEHRAATLAVDFMTRNNGPLSTAHENAIRFIAKALARNGLTEEPSRLVLPLFTGGGKTSTVATYLCALQARSDRGAFVATGTIAQQRELAKTLQDEFKVPADKIGVWNSQEEFTRENAEDFPIMLVTQQRVRTSQVSYLLTYKGRPRQLIWDESLIATTPKSVPVLDLTQKIGKWRTYYKYVKRGYVKGPSLDQDHNAADAYLGDVEKIVDNATPGDTVEFPPWTGGDLDEALKLTKDNLEIVSGLASRKALVKPIGDNTTVLSFVVEVPDELDKIVVLDASGTIRKLQQHDPSLRIVPLTVPKDYSQVVIHWGKTNVGRNTVDNPDKNRDLYREIAELVRRVGRTFVVFTMADRDGVESTGDRLKAFANDDMDLVECVSWGKVSGVNKYRALQHATHIGITYMRPEQLASNIAGQRRDFMFDIDQAETANTRLSEHAHMVYQALSRLACRLTVDGKAPRTDFWLFHNKPEQILAQLRRVMPNFTAVPYEPHVLGQGETVQKHVQQIRQLFVDRGVSKLSVQAMRQALPELPEANSKVWRKLRQRLLNTGRFSLNRRTLVCLA